MAASACKPLALATFSNHSVSSTKLTPTPDRHPQPYRNRVHSRFVGVGAPRSCSCPKVRSTALNREASKRTMTQIALTRILYFHGAYPLNRLLRWHGGPGGDVKLEPGDDAQSPAPCI